MTLRLGSTSPAALRLGATRVSAAYLGGVQVWSDGPAFDPTQFTWTLAATRSEQEPAPDALKLHDGVPPTDLAGWSVQTGAAADYVLTAPAAGKIRMQTAASPGVSLTLTKDGVNAGLRFMTKVVKIRIDAIDTSSGAQLFFIGYWDVATGDHVRAQWSLTGSTLSVVQRVGGVTTTLASTTRTPEVGDILYLAVVNDLVDVLTDEGAGPVSRLRTATTGFQVTDGFSPVLAHNSGVIGNSATFDDFSAGYFGHIARRDTNLVTHANSAPYIEGGLYFFTMSAGTATTSGGSTLSVQTLFSFDPSDYSFAVRATFAAEVSGAMTRLFPGHLVRDGDTWLWFVSGFGSSSGVERGVWMYTTQADVINPGPGGLVEWAGGKDLGLELDGRDADYDPSAVFFDGKWWLGYTLTADGGFGTKNFEPAIAHATDLGATPIAWTFVGRDVPETACEGTKWARTGAGPLLLASRNDQLRVYDRQLQLITTYDTFSATTPPVSPPHVQFFPVAVGQETQWLAVQFTGARKGPPGATFDWGDLEIYTGSIAGPFDPASLYPAAGLWLDPSDLSTLWQDAEGTIPVAADGDPVGRIEDKSGNGHHLVAINGAGTVPVYRTAGGLHWIEADGNDQMKNTSVSFSIDDVYICVGSREDSRSTVTITHSFGGSNLKSLPRLLGNVPFTDGNYYFDAGNTTVGQGRITGAWPHAVGTDHVTWHQRGTGASLVRIDGADAGTATLATTIPVSKIGLLGNDVDAYMTGRFYGMIAVFAAPPDAGTRAQIEGWMAAKSGVTL